MKGIIKEYFNYSKREFKGLIVLILLIIVVFVWPLFHKAFKKDKIVDFELFKTQISQFEEQIEEKEKVKESISYFDFDPNTVSKSDLLRLGFLKKQAQTLINYRNSGGVFVNIIDLKKIYTIDDAMYTNLKPYIKIKQVDKPKTVTSSIKYQINDKESLPKTNKTVRLIELNSADSTNLIKLYGIGSVLSKRIINYRAYLGGYSKSEQLLEVYGIDENTYSLIKNSVIIDKNSIRKINLNTASFKTLNSHPYISYADTKTIIKYRELMEQFYSIDELLENHLIDSLTYNKVKYYISIE